MVQFSNICNDIKQMAQIKLAIRRVIVAIIVHRIITVVKQAAATAIARGFVFVVIVSSLFTHLSDLKKRVWGQ